MWAIAEVIDLVKAGFSLVSLPAMLEKRANPLLLHEVRVGGVPPERIATEIEISPNLLASDEQDAVRTEYYLSSSDHAGWAGECVVRFRVKNQCDKRVSIRGINVIGHKLTIKPKGSVLFVPQGNSTGEVYRFACYLDSISPSMTLLEKWASDGRQTIPRNYFDDSSIELPPNSTINVALHLRTEEASFECLDISLVWQTKQGMGYVNVPLPRKVFVYALNQIPENQRFKRTYDREKPWIALESDARFSGQAPYHWY